MIYNALILPRINYGLLVWGYENEKIFKLQKKAIRLISLAKYNAHTEPLFKTLNLLKINDIFTLKDKYPNFEVGLKCILTVNPYLLVCSYIK